MRKRESYDDLVSYIERDPNKIRYPNRAATFQEQSHYMKHLGGEDYIAMEEQQLRASKEKVKEDIIRERAGGEATSVLVREEVRREAPPPMARREKPVEARREATPETRREATPARAPVAPVESVSPAIAEGIERTVEAEKGKKTDRRFRSRKMVIEELGNTTRIAEAGRLADVKMQPKPTPAPEQVRASSPVIQFVGDVSMEPLGGNEELTYTKASMRRMRKKGAFPEPYGNPLAYRPNANPASSGDPAGSSASADYQRRLREEELLRLEKERLVTQQLENDRKEATRGRSKTVKKKKEKEKETEAEEENAPESKKKKASPIEVIEINEDDGRQRSRSKQGKRRGKDKEKEPEAEKPKAKRPTSDEASQPPKKTKASAFLELPGMTKTEKKEAKKRQQEEQKAEEKQEKRRKPTAKEESKTQYFEIGDIERPKTKKKEEKAKAQKEE